MPEPPLYFLESKWRITKQIRDVPEWTGHVEVERLEFDDATGAGVVHITAQPGRVWQVKMTLSSFQRMIDLGALRPM